METIRKLKAEEQKYNRSLTDVAAVEKQSLIHFQWNQFTAATSCQTAFGPHCIEMGQEYPETSSVIVKFQLKY